jgi:hypothetical protein
VSPSVLIADYSGTLNGRSTEWVWTMWFACGTDVLLRSPPSPSLCSVSVTFECRFRWRRVWRFLWVDRLQYLKQSDPSRSFSLCYSHTLFESSTNEVYLSWPLRLLAPKKS